MMGKLSSGFSCQVVFGIVSLLYGTARCSPEVCKFNGIEYKSGESIAVLEETCTVLLCQGKENDDTLSIIAMPMSSCRCTTPRDVLMSISRPYKHSRSDYNDPLCHYNGKDYNNGDIVASYPDRCFDLVCTKHQDVLSIHARFNVDCTCGARKRNSIQVTEGGNSSYSCSDYKEFDPYHSMCLPQNKECKPFSKGISDSEKEIILMLHNERRVKVAKGLETLGDPGPQPPATNMRELVWNDELAAVAQAWANQCPHRHDLYRCRKITGRDYYVGQNIFWSFSTSNKQGQQWKNAVRYFYEEVNYLPSTHVDGFAPSPSGKVIGHYTQLVWADTNEVGCGAIERECERKGVSYKNCKTYVCNYGPAANVKRRPIYQRGKTASNCLHGKSKQYEGLCN